MGFRRLALLLLLPAALLLGPGGSLRFCMQQVLEQSGCCDTERAPRCCPDEQRGPLDPVVRTTGSCDACCIDLSTPFARTLPASERLADELERAQVVALFFPVETLVPRALGAHACPHGRVPTVPRGPRGPRGHWTPLPLRI